MNRFFKLILFLTIIISVSLSTNIPNVSASLTDGLVSHYTFDEGSGTTAGDSAGSNAGTLTNGPTWATGKVGSGALQFDGTDDFVKLTSRITSPGTFSMSLWFYPKTVSYAGGVLIGGLNANSQITAGPIVTVRDNGAAATDVAILKPLFANKWQHLAVTRGASNAILIYLNGENVTTGTPTFSITKYWDYIGSRSDGLYPFSGSLDDIRIYSRVLDSNEIEELNDMGAVVASGDTEAPSIPSGLTASPTSQSKINLSWTASTDNTAVTGYKIYRGGSEIATTPNTSYEDTGLSPSIPYTYTVLAYDAIGNQSEKSSPTSATIQSDTPVADTPPPADNTVWYVSPTGTSAGTGSITSPWDLQTAFTNTGKKIKPGHTVWMRGGVYGLGGNTVFGHRWDGLSGTSGNQITFRNYANERAIINGSIAGSGNYLTFFGFEIMNSNPVRKISTFDKPGGINIGGKGNRVINLVIHDVGHSPIGGISEGEIYGVIMWGSGIYDTSNPLYPNGLARGSGMYLQNRNGNSYVSDSISFKQFTTGMKAYAQEGHVNGFKFEGNVVFDNNDINLETIAITNPAKDISWIENYTYTDPLDIKKPAQLGWVSNDMIDAIVKDNYFVNGSNPKGALFVHKWKDLNVTGNTFISQRQAANVPVLSFDMPDTTTSHTWNSNKYYGGNSSSLFFLDNVAKTFDQWKSTTGFDSNSTYSSSLPSTNAIFVRPNKYEQGRAHVIVYNWENKNQVNVNISNIGLQTGDNFAIFDVQNFLGEPVMRGVYNGQSVDLPMNLTTITPLIGRQNITHFNPNTHTDKKFNVFVVLKTNGVYSQQNYVIPPPPANLPPPTVEIPNLPIDLLVNGSCSTRLNRCSNGTVSGRTSNTTHNLWTCNGLNGGTNASCSTLKTVEDPVNPIAPADPLPTPPSALNPLTPTYTPAYTPAHTPTPYTYKKPTTSTPKPIAGTPDLPPSPSFEPLDFIPTDYIQILLDLIKQFFINLMERIKRGVERIIG